MGGGYGGGGNPSCCFHFHPEQETVGVCALCLRERLLVLASNYPQKTLKQTKSRIRIGKVFVLPSFFHLSHPNNKFDEEAAPSASISSLEESFISIKFEENGQTSWHSNARLPPSSGFVGYTKYGISSQRTEKQGDEVAMRWLDRIGQLALYWKSEKKDSTNRTRSSSSANNCYDVKVDERLGKGRKGWMKSITRKRSRTNKQKGE